MIDDIASEDLHWLAGLVEGEGSIRSEKRGNSVTLRLRVSMTDRDVVDRAAGIFGSKAMGPYHLKKRPHTSPIWTFQVTRRDLVVPLLRRLYPLLGERRKAQIDKCLRALLESQPCAL